MADVQKSFEEQLRQRFADFVSSRGSPMLALFDTIRIMRMRGWTAFVFGGVPRGIFDTGPRYVPRDLDLVFDDEHFGYFESAFADYVLKRNNYGGLKLRFKDLLIDAWPLHSTWAFRERYLSNPSFENLPNTTFLNIDGIIIEAVTPKFTKRRIYEAGFFRAWNERVLDINLMNNPFPGICVARTLNVARRFGFRLSYKLAMYVWNSMTTQPLSLFEKAQISHYGRIQFDLHQLREIRCSLESQLATAGLFPINLFAPPTNQAEFRFPLPTARRKPVGLDDVVKCNVNRGKNEGVANELIAA